MFDDSWTPSSTGLLKDLDFYTCMNISDCFNLIFTKRFKEKRRLLKMNNPFCFDPFKYIKALCKIFVFA